LHIKSGIRYSPPFQNQVVAAQDVFERAFTANVPNGYAFSYFSSIVGAPACPGCLQADLRDHDAESDDDRPSPEGT
jgi:hypothetical protein